MQRYSRGVLILAAHALRRKTKNKNKNVSLHPLDIPILSRERDTVYKYHPPFGARRFAGN